MTIQQITFSPTGGTLKVCTALSKGFGCRIEATELCVKNTLIASPTISSDDIVIIGMPVYAGRVPTIAVERLRRIESNNARCVIVAVYGNREYDDALVELQDVATECGYKVIAAVSAIAEHSVVREFATGRPNEDDNAELFSFAARIKQKLESASKSSELTLPGNRPYKTISSSPSPQADDTCGSCGVCAEECPTDAISMDNPRTVNKDACISCMRCIAVCPTGSRSLGPIVAMLAERLRPVCSEPKKNELFV